MNAAKLFALAWRGVPRLPGPLARGMFDAVALIAHTLRIAGVRQLETNIARLRPDLDRRALRRISRAGMRTYMRYYCELFQLPALRPDQVDARVRTVGAEAVREQLAHGSVIAALGHSGNWDLAGAWAGRHLARVLTVAEVLEPRELFNEFLDFRASLGMEVIGLERGSSVFRQLIGKAHSRTYLVPLLADRDLSRTSVQVDAGGHPMRIAAGPAALALAIGAPLVQIFIRHERLRGARRRRAGSPWGIVLEFIGVDLPASTPSEERVQALSQAWMNVFVDQVRRYPDHWHMLQKVFVEDLDHERLARGLNVQEARTGLQSQPGHTGRAHTSGETPPPADPEETR